MRGFRVRPPGLSATDLLKFRVKAVSNIHRQGNKKNIVLFSTPRSGSTWLLGLIAAEPRMKHFDEPCNIRRLPVAATGIFESWADLMPGSCQESTIFDYLNGLVENRYPFMNPAPLRKNHSFLTDRVVFKIHELEFLMGGIASACNTRHIYLIRHPIATTLSRELHPRLEWFLKSEHYMEKLLAPEQARAVERAVASGSHFEKGIASWAFENLDAVRGDNLSIDLMVSYEELVLDPRGVLTSMCKLLDLESRDRMIRMIEKPASNIYKSKSSTKAIMSAHTGASRSRKLVTKWKSAATEDQEARTFEILETFGLNIYERGGYLPSAGFLLNPSLRQLELDG